MSRQSVESCIEGFPWSLSWGHIPIFSHILSESNSRTLSRGTSSMRMFAGALSKSSVSQCYIFVLLYLVHLADLFHILSKLPLFYPHIPSLTSPVTKLGNPEPFHHGTSPLQILQYSAPELPTWIPSSQERPITYLSLSLPQSNQLIVVPTHNLHLNHLVTSRGPPRLGDLVTSRGPPRPSCATRLKPTDGFSTYGNAIFQVGSVLTFRVYYLIFPNP